MYLNTKLIKRRRKEMKKEVFELIKQKVDDVVEMFFNRYSIGKIKEKYYETI